MCGCNKTGPADQTEYAVLDRTGAKVGVVKGESNAKIEVTRIGGGTYKAVGK